MSDVPASALAVRQPRKADHWWSRRGAVEMSAEAFAQLIRSHERGLCQVAYRLLGSADEMEEALQEACVKAYRARGDLRVVDPQVVSTWLYRIVYRTCIDRLRKRQRSEDATVHAERLATSSTPDFAEAVAERIDVEHALADLPPELKATIILVDVLGFDYTGAANVLGVPPGTVGSRLTRARSGLRARLECGLAVGHSIEGS